MSVDLGLKFKYDAVAWEVDRKVSDQSALLSDRELNEFLDYVLPHNGRVIWRGRGRNLVTNVGARWLINHGFHTALTTIPWFIMPKSTGTAVAADTVASHASWTEITAYTPNARPALTITAAASGRSTSNSANLASITATGSITVAGFALVSVSAKSDNANGTLFSVSDFGTAWVGAATNILRITATVSA